MPYTRERRVNIGVSLDHLITSVCKLFLLLMDVPLFSIQGGQGVVRVLWGGDWGKYTVARGQSTVTRPAQRRCLFRRCIWPIVTSICLSLVSASSTCWLYGRAVVVNFAGEPLERYDSPFFFFPSRKCLSWSTAVHLRFYGVTK